MSQSSGTPRKQYPYLPNSQDIELVSDDVPRGGFRSVLFDFDGTISLIREGWRGIMIPLMVEILADLETGESEEQLEGIVADFVDRLTGKQTIYQAIQLCEEIKTRGGSPEDPLVYKQRYHDRLLQHIDNRLQGLRSGSTDPGDLMVPGSIDLLENLADQGLTLYLASGTDVDYVLEEARLLGVTTFFPDRIFGALDSYENFSKAMVIQDIIKTHGLKGEELLGFGDGYVEIENVKEVGGTAVGVATDEANPKGVDAWKRERLIGAGADLIIPEYREQETLVAYLCNA